MENPIQEITDLLAAVKNLCRRGYVINGEISLVKPAMPGKMETDCRVFAQPCLRLEMKPVRVNEKALTLPAALLGEICSNCGGSRLQQAGACKVCLDCGQAGGCG